MLFNFQQLLEAIMIVFLAISYALIACLFMLICYVTTARDRLHLGLSVLASAFFPLSLLLVIGYISSQRLVGLLSKLSGSSEESEGTPEFIATRAPDDIVRRIRPPVTHRGAVEWEKSDA